MLRLLLSVATVSCLVITAAFLSKQFAYVRRADDGEKVAVARTNHNETDVNGTNVNIDSNNKRKEWDEWFHPPFNPTHFNDSTNGTKAHSILYYHVQKTGGSTLYHLFDGLNEKNGMPDNPGKTPGRHGIERPGHISEFLKWKRNAKNESRLLTISFREPVERVISHYFQLKPCPDGSGGGFHKACRASAEQGFSTYLQTCPFSSNYQSQYVNGHYNLVDDFDFVILNHLSEESLVLASIRFKIPISDFMHFHNRKVRVGTSDLRNDKNNNLSCTAQWMKRLVPPDKLQEVEACTHSCAGKIGRLIFTQDEIDNVKARNRMDTKLWRKHVVPKYNADKKRVLHEYGVSQADLDKVVEKYREMMG